MLRETRGSSDALGFRVDPSKSLGETNEKSFEDYSGLFIDFGRRANTSNVERESNATFSG
eukprot:scaffold7489_cov96-Cylindrotheca_fusiformis.AAC.7